MEGHDFGSFKEEEQDTTYVTVPLEQLYEEHIEVLNDQDRCIDDTDVNSLSEIPRDLSFMDYSGPCNFNVRVDATTQSSSFSFWEAHNKIYVDSETEFPLDFEVTDDYPSNENFFVRATPVFSQKDFQRQVRVCPTHAAKLNIGENSEFMNVLRCNNKYAMYFGNSEKKLNIVFPMDRSSPSLKYMRVFFKFICLTSCPSGMNREMINVIFTLENVWGKVYGRRNFSVKIAKNIKRDMLNDQKCANNNPMMYPRKRQRRMSKSPEVGKMEIYSTIFNMIPDEDVRKINEYMCMLMISKISECGGPNSPTAARYVEIRDLIPLSFN